MLKFNEIVGSVTVDPRSVPVQQRVEQLMGEKKMCNRCALLAAGKDEGLARFIEANCDAAITRALEIQRRAPGLAFHEALDRAWKELGAQFRETFDSNWVELHPSECRDCKNISER